MDIAVIPYKLMFSNMSLNDVIFKVILCLSENGIVLIKNPGTHLAAEGVSASVISVASVTSVSVSFRS